MTDEEHKKLTDRVKALTEEFPNFSFTVVIQPDDNDYETVVAGNLCAVCATRTLVELIEEGRLKHTADSIGEVTKH